MADEVMQGLNGNLDAMDEIIPTVMYFVERHCTPDWRLSNDDIPYHDLTFVVGGRAVYEVNGVPVALQPGSMVYLPSGSTRKAHTFADAPMHCFAFNFRCRNNQEEVLHLPLPTHMAWPLDSEVFRLLREMTLIHLEQGPGYGMASRAMLLLVLQKALFHASPGRLAVEDARIREVNTWLMSHFSEPLDIAALAERVRLHPVYLGQLFRQINGCTLQAFVTRLRVAYADNLLVTGGYSVSEVARMSGYDDVGYFSRVFRKLKGCAPSSRILGGGIRGTL